MSWPIANNLLIHGEDEDTTTPTSNDGPQSVNQQEGSGSGSDSQTLAEGVKGDLSDFTESLARQLWGVASFLAPPPPPRFATTTKDDPSSGVSNSICEFGAETGVSNSSTFLNDGEEENENFVGVTEEVLAFAMNISHHPETWLDFPLSEEEDTDDFEMSDTQWNHATLVEHLVPRLAALRIELCPIHTSESYFWKVYFVLLHPRLNKHDAVLLSTPQIVAARTMWMKELQMQTKPGPDLFHGNASDRLHSHEEFNTTCLDSPSATNHAVAEKHACDEPREEGSIKATSDQRVLPIYKIPIEEFDDDEDDWIHENSELDGYDGPDIGDDENISFSDLEDDECTMPTKSKVLL